MKLRNIVLVNGEKNMFKFSLNKRKMIVNNNITLLSDDKLE